MNKKEKYLEMIQIVMNRMASNSFALKGWTVTLVAGIFVLANKDSSKNFCIVAFIPIAVFWFLDSYYLLQERLYRCLYNSARKIDSDDKVDYDLNAHREEYVKGKNTFKSCLISKTEAGFYGPLAALSFFVVFLI